jgi:competence protein ComEC
MSRISMSILLRCARQYVALLLLFLVVCFRLYVSNRTFACLGYREPPSFVNVPFVVSLRDMATNNIERHFSSPYSDLLLGMVVGIDGFSNIPRFKQQLVATGTIHIVVVSGFNISLVSSLILRMLGSVYKFRNVILVQAATFGYSILSGFSPPVVRAWVMGSLVSWCRYSGREVRSSYIFVLAILLMLAASPCNLYSLSFQLSALATLGLILFTEPTTQLLYRMFKLRGGFVEDLSSTISAQILVIPLISYTFGRVSISSLVANMCVLWCVPLITVLGSVLALVPPALSSLVLPIILIVRLLLHYVRNILELISLFPYSSVDLAISSRALVSYYVGVCICILVVGLYDRGRQC